ncbi:AAA family ATPase [Nonomuraea sp. NPDC050536]|uniref:AAA family ATPase n=1 Tax=Nonomuraea sp. NPDC050536 TaxID=3364366 RepID=UPI0037C81848
MADLLVLVNGLPGAGKSTLGRPLATQLNARFLSKDAVKEALATCADGDLAALGDGLRRLHGPGRAYQACRSGVLCNVVVNPERVMSTAVAFWLLDRVKGSPGHPPVSPPGILDGRASVNSPSRAMQDHARCLCGKAGVGM